MLTIKKIIYENRRRICFSLFVSREKIKQHEVNPFNTAKFKKYNLTLKGANYSPFPFPFKKRSERSLKDHNSRWNNLYRSGIKQKHC